MRKTTEKPSTVPFADHLPYVRMWICIMAGMDMDSFLGTWVPVGALMVSVLAFIQSCRLSSLPSVPASTGWKRWATVSGHRRTVFICRPKCCSKSETRAVCRPRNWRSGECIAGLTCMSGNGL